MRMRSSEPYSISSMASSGSSATGVFKVASYFSSKAAICQNIMAFLLLPKGAMAPSAMERLRSGITLSMSIWLTTPSPLHLGHAPCGELNEKLWGAGSR